MSEKEIRNTLINLRQEIANIEERTLKKADIRVCIGRVLLMQLIAYNGNAITNYADDTQASSIFGCPVEIEYSNPMCLEIHNVTRVPIYKESEV